MKQKLFAMMAAAMLLLGLTACSNDDNPSTSVKEQSLVGLWWDEFEYADVTEDGVPFSSVLLAVQVDADHTGCIYLGLFNATSDIPLAVYGGPKDAGFKWQLLDGDRVLLTDPTTGESAVLARTRGEGSSYGEDMTNVSNTNVSCSDGAMQVDNGTYSGTLLKANADERADIEEKLQGIISAVNSGDAGIGYGGQSDGPARTRSFNN